MASGLVSMVGKSRPDAKTYGFQYLPQRRVYLISNRLFSAHTRTSEVALIERGNFLFKRNLKAVNSPNPPFSSCPRSGVARYDLLSEIASAQTNTTTNKNLQKIIQRLQRPTTSSNMVKRSKLTNDVSETVVEKPLLDVSPSKSFRKHTRPTTSSSLKRLGVCGYCDDVEIDCERFESKIEPDRIRELRLSGAEYKEAVERVRSPTHASMSGQSVCAKMPLVFRTSTVEKDELPLLCGLARSQTVEEITNRLYYVKRTKTQQTPLLSIKVGI